MIRTAKLICWQNAAVLSLFAISDHPNMTSDIINWKVPGKVCLAQMIKCTITLKVELNDIKPTAAASTEMTYSNLTNLDFYSLLQQTLCTQVKSPW